jgi:hypothetical protein
VYRYIIRRGNTPDTIHQQIIQRPTLFITQRTKKTHCYTIKLPKKLIILNFNPKPPFTHTPIKPTPHKNYQNPTSIYTKPIKTQVIETLQLCLRLLPRDWPHDTMLCEHTHSRAQVSVFMYICMYICIYVCLCVCEHIYVCMYVCIYVCMYGYIYVCMYIHSCANTHTAECRSAMPLKPSLSTTLKP